MIREFVVRRIKPKVPEPAWRLIRRIDRTSRQRDRRRAARTGRSDGSGQPSSNAARPSLTELAIEFGTDKWGRHRYTPHYEGHLSPLRDEKFTLLEIGIGGYKRQGAGGASLRMWKQYFSRAQILGLDIEDKSFVNEDRIQAYQGSQVDKKLLRTLVRGAKDLRVVIDDGSHRNEHVLATFAYLFPLLREDAIYIIEDTETSYRENYGGSRDLSAPRTTMNMVKALLDGLNYVEYATPDYEPSYTDRHVVGVHAYHNLVFIEKGRNDEERSRGPYTPAELAAVAGRGADDGGTA